MHIITKSNKIVVGYVEAAGIDKGYLSNQGRSFVYESKRRIAAEAIVVADTSLCPEETTQEVSQNS
jgi:chaperonin GroEL (HSP60 family)